MAMEATHIRFALDLVEILLAHYADILQQE